MTDLALDTELSDEQREYLTTVKSSADSLLNLINDILDFSKIECGQLELEEAGFALRRQIESVVKGLALRAHRKGLELICNIDPDVPDNLIGDSTRLRQIITNLVGNAVKFTEQGEVELQVCLLQSGDDNVVLRFAVRDTGIGIADDRLESIFDSFVQADGSITRRYGGTGLGLSISKRLVALMGGNLEVSSREGLGSTFSFTMNLRVDDSPAPAQTESRLDIQGLLSLVVDDNETNRRLLRTLLDNWGFAVGEAGGGREAVEELLRAKRAGTPYHLVLLDACMPEVDGFTVAEKIKNQPELADPVIMMLTSADRHGDMLRCRELGVSSYLVKPIGQSDLWDAILTALGRRLHASAPRRRGSSVGRAERSLNILLAEDNLANQKLACRLLEKRGHRVAVVADGRAVLEALEKERFDLVLMDCQMPVMDGYEATSAIRRQEQHSGEHIPVVAMTAHAIKGDREKCLAVGMDDYISKPIHRERLYEVVERMARRETGEPAAGRDEQSTPAGSSGEFKSIDPERIHQLVSDDAELLNEVAEIFLVESEQLLHTIQDCLASGDAGQLCEAAHSIKGAVGNFGAQEAYDAAQDVEEASRSKNFDALGGGVEVLEDRLKKVRDELAQLVSDEGGGQ